MKIKKLFFIAALLISCGMYAQENHTPSEVITGTYKGLTIPLRDFPTLDTNSYDPNNLTMIINESNTVPQENLTTTVIQNLQTVPGGITALPITQNFIGFSANESGGFFPPDPTGAAGPNHYVHAVNSAVKIFDKNGSILVGPVSLSAFLGNGSNNGDPIVLYDQLADRWMVSEFGAGTNSLSIGISETNDPTGAFNVWEFTYPGGFPDYPHYAVWHDGYYGTVNIPGGSGSSTFVMERDVMLAGGANPQLAIFTLPGNIYNPNQVKSAEPANLLGTTIDPSTPGYITYLQDDAWSAAIEYDHIKIWEIYMNWNNINNSTISDPIEIPTDPFDAGELFGNGNGAIHQPGTSQRLAGHGGIVSFGANYRAFVDHNSWLITFNTFIDGNETGGIRWLELRNDDVSPWETFQEGTYSIADGHSRLMSSSAMDANGNIAMAYTTASETLKVSLRYTGRFDGDPLGDMTIAETTIINGNGVRTNANRYGDYSHMTMDPDNFTFWYTADYFSSNNFWRTQVAAFRLFGPFADDVGVNAIVSPGNGEFTNSETVEISIRNYSPDAITNIPVELRVDGSLIASETFTGTVNPNEAETYQFSQTIDLSTAGQTYSIEAKTNLTGDGYVSNDDYTKEVMHLLSDDVGVIEVASPESGSDLGNETIIVKVKNFGATTQTGFNVEYILDSGTPVVQSFSGNIGSEEIMSFTFSEAGDFSEVGEHSLTVKTNLSGDQLVSNDEISVIVENLMCMPTSNCTVGHGFAVFEVGGINNTSDCEDDGYGDFTSLVANLEPGSTNDLTVTANYGSQYITVWVDFNDDFQFTSDELVVDNYNFAPGQGAGNITESMDLVIPANAAIGEHRMRARASGTGPVSSDACEEILFGETEDYTANIGLLGVEDYEINNSDLIITSTGGNQFEATLRTDYDGGVFLAIYNTLGQRVGFNKRVPNFDGTYRLNIDMSNMSAGIYYVRMGGQTTTAFKTSKLIVK
jgi:hypothetical protein